MFTTSKARVKILFTLIEGTILYLTPQRMASDRVERADKFQTDEQAEAARVQQNCDEGWSRFHVRWQMKDL
jgi:prophage tail gpP-like protein